MSFCYGASDKMGQERRLLREEEGDKKRRMDANKEAKDPSSFSPPPSNWSPEGETFRVIHQDDFGKIGLESELPNAIGNDCEAQKFNPSPLFLHFPLIPLVSPTYNKKILMNLALRRRRQKCQVGVRGRKLPGVKLGGTFSPSSLFWLHPRPTTASSLPLPTSNQPPQRGSFLLTTTGEEV